MEEAVLDDYNSPEGAKSYTGKFERHWIERINNIREQRLIRELLGDIPQCEIALDLPCGYGRLYPLLEGVSSRIVEGDWSFYMLKEARRRLDAREKPGRPGGFVRATAFNLPFGDRTFDLVFSARLCHHMSSHDERVQYVREILRISARSAIFTFFDAASVKNRVHRFKRRFVERTPKFTLSRGDIDRIANESGFQITRSVLLSRLFSGHRYIVLQRLTH